MRTLQRVVIAVTVVLLVAAGLLVVMFALGRPVSPQVPPRAAAPAPGTPGSGESGGPGGSGAPTGGSDRLAIEIPGCVCHSDDPDVVAEHAKYRLSECFDCHQGGMPQMGQ